MTGSQRRELDAAAVRTWARTALRELSAAREEINRLNVYPVPDADTGTNLFLTLQGAVDALEALADDAPPADVLSCLARGALFEAHGNSGVILSQLLRGFADFLGEGSRDGRGPDATAVAGALSAATDAAYAAVARPVEGTMLTVLRAAARAAQDASSLPDLASSAARAARTALAETPDQLDVLREAGVVDAGGLGICVLLDALQQVVSGSAPASSAAEAVDVAATTAATVDGAYTGPSYELMFLLDADADSVAALREALTALGDSVVVAGSTPTWNVHAHVDDVEAALAVAASAGRPHGVRVTNLHEADGAH